MKKSIILIIKLYQRFISPMLGANCRFYPTCSSYAIDAITHYGAVKGSLYAIYRILRCNPFSKGGIDYPYDICCKTTKEE